VLDLTGVVVGSGSRPCSSPTRVADVLKIEADRRVTITRPAAAPPSTRPASSPALFISSNRGKRPRWRSTIKSEIGRESSGQARGPGRRAGAEFSVPAPMERGSGLGPDELRKRQFPPPDLMYRSAGSARTGPYVKKRRLRSDYSRGLSGFRRYPVAAGDQSPADDSAPSSATRPPRFSPRQAVSSALLCP